MNPDKSRCSQCETPLLYTKHSKTFRGKIERWVQKIGIATVIVVVGFGLLLFLTGGVFVAYYLVSSGAKSDGAANVNIIVNDSVKAAPGNPATFKVVIPGNAKNSRVVGGFKVTSGNTVNFYVVSENNLPGWSNGTMTGALAQREHVNSLKIRQLLQPGIYYLVFTTSDSFTPVTVAAELYSKYD